MLIHKSRPVLLLLDWDGTLTLKSTLGLIASISTHPSIHPNLSGLSKAYSDDLKIHERKYRLQKKDRKSLSDELEYLESLEAVERASIQRIEASDILKDVSATDVDAAADDAVERRKIVLRRGWEKMIESVQQRNGRIGIISVAWSAHFISTALTISATTPPAKGTAIRLDEVEVRANEILADGSGRLDRYFRSEDRGIWTGDGKVRVMDEMIDSFIESEGEGAKPRVVYVGDSPTDLGCLMNADVGVCVRDGDAGLTGEQEALREVLGRVGVGCVHVREFRKWSTGEKSRGRIGQGVGEGENEGQRTLWWARDFEEVCESGVLDGS